jgi:hypothetical protein
MIAAWAARQGAIAGDSHFQQAFLAQMQNLAAQLETISLAGGTTPMALQLSDLVAWTRQLADERLTPLEATGSPPPG